MRRSNRAGPVSSQRRSVPLAAACGALVMACASPRATPGEAAESGGSSGSPATEATAMIAEEVRLTLTVVGGPPRAGETFELALTVFNDGELDAVIDFPNGQRYDFEIFATDGTRVWQWAEGMMFTMMIGRETIRGGETLRWTERIPTGLEAGTYRVVGTLAAMERQAVEMTLQVTAP